MKKSRKWTGFVICLAFLFAASVIFIEETYSTGGTTAPAPGTSAVTLTKPQPKPLCCIAWEYKVHHKDTPSKTCPTPGEGDSIMVINQDKGCGSKIWGTVTNVKDKSIIQNFEGTVKQREKCCYIEGIMKKPAAAAGAPGETTKFWGLLCKNGKWAGKGSYTNTRPGVTCNGTWEMWQM
jgi:hypothetical protein